MTGNGQVVQVAQVLYPPEARSRTRKLARAAAHNTLENVLIWRDLKAEIPRGAITTIEAMYASDMMISASTLRRHIAQVRDFDAEYLEGLVNSGVSWEHLQIAGELAEVAHKTPMQLLNEAIDPGNASGETMTVDELTAYALGERVPRPETFAAVGWLSRLAELPARLGWDADKATRYGAWIEQGKEFLK